MDLLDLLANMRDILGHNNVRWDSQNGEIRIYTGLTMRDAAGKVDVTGPLRQNETTVALMGME